MDWLFFYWITMKDFTRFFCEPDRLVGRVRHGTPSVIKIGWPRMWAGVSDCGLPLVSPLLSPAMVAAVAVTVDAAIAVDGTLFLNVDTQMKNSVHFVKIESIFAQRLSCRIACWQRCQKENGAVEVYANLLLSRKTRLLNLVDTLNLSNRLLDDQNVKISIKCAKSTTGIVC